MDNAGYVTLTRQSGLMREMQAVAHNIANAATTGFRKEGVIFAEYVVAPDGDGPSLSMARASARHISEAPGVMKQTGGAFDFAIQGAGFFQVETPEGVRLTRAGSFAPDAGGNLATPDGHPLLDAGGAPVFIPPDARAITLAGDGTLSADGQPLAQIGLMRPTDPNSLQRESGALFRSDAGVEPVEDAQMIQGFIEASNVSAITEIARMIEVQRAYEMGQTFLDNEDQRIRSVIQTLGR
jgi:flagellar basal-body rod protein FlgF